MPPHLPGPESIHSSAPRRRALHTDRALVVVPLLVVAACVTALSVERYVFIQRSTTTADRLRQAAEVTGEMLREDEILTMSANMAAATGDPRWALRYDAHVAVIDSTVERALRLAPTEAARRFSDAAKLSNDALLASETRVFALVRQRRLVEAQQVLEAPGYARYKTMLASAQQNFLHDLAMDASREHRVAQNISTAIFVAICLAMAACISLVLFRARRRVDERLHADTIATVAGIHDPLTGLPSRELLEHHVARRMAERSRDGAMFAVLQVGVDGLGRTNSASGHAAGNEVLVAVAERLARHVRQDELAARLDGDRFAVVLTIGDDARDGITRAAERLLDALAQPVASLRFGTLPVGASIGIVLFPDHADDMEQLLGRAELAMTVAKREGPGFARYFRASMLAAAPAGTR
jgi:diguanylate cyclase (GGDEF)-like protein